MPRCGGCAWEGFCRRKASLLKEVLEAAKRARIGRPGGSSRACVSKSVNFPERGKLEKDEKKIRFVLRLREKKLWREDRDLPVSPPSAS